MNYGSYRGVKLLDHGMKIIERGWREEYENYLILIKHSLVSCVEREQRMPYS